MARISDSSSQSVLFLTLSLLAAATPLFQTRGGVLLGGTIGLLCGSAANETFSNKSDPNVDRILRFSLGFFIGSVFVAPLCSKLLSKRFALSLLGGLCLGSAAILEWSFFTLFKEQADIQRRENEHQRVIDESQRVRDESQRIDNRLDENHNRLDEQRRAIDELRLRINRVGRRIYAQQDKSASAA